VLAAATGLGQDGPVEIRHPREKDRRHVWNPDPRRAMSALADPRVQSFLATREVVVLATLMPDGAPVATPMWFLPEPDALVMLSVDDLRKVSNLRRDPRVAVVAETTTPEGAIRGVTVRGRAEILAESIERRALVGRFLERYHPRLERIWGSRAMPANRVMFRIVPERVRSWGLG
jgi:PPOX class probable F420-dependent enzyme